MVLAQKQKYRPMEQDKKPRDKSMLLRVPYLDKKKKKGKNIQQRKTASSIGGSGKTRQLHVKE